MRVAKAVDHDEAVREYSKKNAKPIMSDLPKYVAPSYEWDKTKSYRDWIVVLNNYLDRDWEYLSGVQLDHEKIRISYMVMGKEVGESGTPHLQGYVIFENPIRFRTVCTRLGSEKWHVEPKKTHSTIERAILYCKKGEQTKKEWEVEHNNGPNFGLNAVILERGKIPPGQGCRTDLKEIADSIMKGETNINDILIDKPSLYHQYGRTLENLQSKALQKTHRTKAPICLWIWGPTGVGKSHYCYPQDKIEKGMIYDHPCGKKNDWWCNYNQEPICIFNEIRAGDFKLTELLKMCDKFPFSVERKCKNTIPFISKVIVFTSAKPPNEIYSGGFSEDLAQIDRRICTFQMSNKEDQKALPTMDELLEIWEQQK